MRNVHGGKRVWLFLTPVQGGDHDHAASRVLSPGPTFKVSLRLRRLPGEDLVIYHNGYGNVETELF